jgi:hypothetical protein
MRNLSCLAGIVSILVFFTACKQSTENAARLSVKELDVIEYVIRLSYGDGRYPTGHLDFLTTTAMPTDRSEWKWQDLPDEFHRRISDLPVRFRKASEAYLDGGQCVRQKGTQVDGYMHWVSIKRWLSDDEVEVELGRWSRQLHGGGKTYILEKKSGKWSIKKRVRLWVT